MAETQVTDVETAREALKEATRSASLESNVPKTKAQKVRELRQEILQFRVLGKELARSGSGASRIVGCQCLRSGRCSARRIPVRSLRSSFRRQKDGCQRSRRRRSASASVGRWTPKPDSDGHELSSGDQKWLRGRLCSPAQRAASSGVCKPLGISLVGVFGEAHVAGSEPPARRRGRGR